ncbi:MULTISPECIES: VOC family protein [unclassified Acinetobacter]|uniref:VOC family protein n=1 Tax=unclassified Acinetobacter TaxID=196816 RepID=UPI00190DB45B|nr:MULTISPECIES: VOC family protein [unclassified Acinetobacter]MBK0064333.1 VOC family protein [Acinetobacter sp. S55]MBK0067860.1 VOC family protein [Acinetobacter sp. S54]
MQLNHYLNFNGEAEAAFNFYQSVFGGEFAMMTRYADLPAQDGVVLSESQRNLILHVSLTINEFTVLMGSDVNEQFCSPANAILNKGNNHYISINLENDETETRRLFNLLSMAGLVEMPLQKTFWGALYGAFTDQFGIKWMVNCQLGME